MFFLIQSVHSVILIFVYVFYPRTTHPPPFVPAFFPYLVQCARSQLNLDSGSSQKHQASFSKYHQIQHADLHSRSLRKYPQEALPPFILGRAEDCPEVRQN
jgi:hypothetical protein